MDKLGDVGGRQVGGGGGGGGVKGSSYVLRLGTRLETSGLREQEQAEVGVINQFYRLMKPRVYIYTFTDHFY